MTTELPPTPEQFVQRYEQALATQDWAVVDPLIDDDACVTFSNGAVHIGKAAIQRAFEENFAAIEDEAYRISNVHWVERNRASAVYLFDFDWNGRIDGRQAAGAGRGTCVLRHGTNGWRLLIEHLGPRAS
jgi:ketosteroid isomerase-like protein